jgi:hypothetical protein
VKRRIASLRARPITGRERQTATSALFVCIIVATLLLAIGRAQTREPVPAGAHAPTPSVTNPVPSDSASVTAQVATRIARRFLGGYLAYLYRGLPGRKVSDGTARLIRSLGEHPPRPVAGALSRPRIVAVDLARTTSGQLVANALVNDGGIVNFTVGLLIARQSQHVLVTGLESAR